MKNAKQTILVRAPGAPYRVLIEPGVLDRLGPRLKANGVTGRVIVVSDAQVAALYAGRVQKSLRKSGYSTDLITIKPGERNKTLAAVSRVYQHLAELGVDRTTHVIALGGGVVGDLAGFAAATYLRGLPLIQVPTTVLAQADSSVGGKTGVNLERGKNLVGAFHQPRLVVVDPRAIQTLAPRQVRSGFAEIIKVGMALDATLFRQIERESELLLGLQEDRYVAALVRAIRAKARVVVADEREKGRRMLLNYGHTVGHAIEAAGKYRRWLHGEAVAIGMEAAARLAVRKKILSTRDYQRQRDVLEDFGFSLAVRRLAVEDILLPLQLDKKARSGRPAFVLTRGVGVASVHRTLTRRDIVETLLSLGAET